MLCWYKTNLHILLKTRQFFTTSIKKLHIASGVERNSVT